LTTETRFHKVLTYVENRAVSGVFQNIDPLPPLHPEGASSPAPKAWGERVRGSIFWKTPDIGLASYSIIPLRQILTPVILNNILKDFHAATGNSKNQAYFLFKDAFMEF
jgi:hypothetical protein